MYSRYVDYRVTLAMYTLPSFPLETTRNTLHHAVWPEHYELVFCYIMVAAAIPMECRSGESKETEAGKSDPPRRPTRSTLQIPTAKNFSDGLQPRTNKPRKSLIPQVIPEVVVEEPEEEDEQNDVVKPELCELSPFTPNGRNRYSTPAHLSAHLDEEDEQYRFQPILRFSTGAYKLNHTESPTPSPIERASGVVSRTVTEEEETVDSESERTTAVALRDEVSILVSE